MPAFGIIDDRVEVRETTRRRIDEKLGPHNGWECIDSAPFAEMDEYSSWIAENDISVLILDERLNEWIPPGSFPVGYEGHDLVDFLRGQYETLPIYMVTTFPQDDNVESRFPSVEAIISRDEFSKRIDHHMARMLRAGTKFYEDNQAELEMLALLAGKIANGVASEAEIQKVEGLQLSRMLPFSSVIGRSNWLKSYEKTADEFEELNAKIAKYLDNEVD